MKACVDKKKCIGCGLCTSICPEVFEMGEDGFSNVKVEEIPSGLLDSVKEAADSCPAEAITIE